MKDGVFVFNSIKTNTKHCKYKPNRNFHHTKLYHAWNNVMIQTKWFNFKPSTTSTQTIKKHHLHTPTSSHGSGPWINSYVVLWTTLQVDLIWHVKWSVSIMYGSFYVSFTISLQKETSFNELLLEIIHPSAGQNTLIILPFWPL